jgi:hypothetical protein
MFPSMALILAARRKKSRADFAYCHAPIAEFDARILTRGRRGETARRKVPTAWTRLVRIAKFDLRRVCA